MTRSPRRPGVAALGVALLLLAACTAEQGELQQWADQQRREVKPKLAPLAPPKKFEPHPYNEARAVDPFSIQKLAVALKQEARQANSLLAAEMNRRREPLESFPTDSMAMVGSVSRKGRPFALLRVDNLLYQVKVGDYMGLNYGRVMKIDETELTLREIVQDASGEWVERVSSLLLQDKAR
jgi:type IV pilus assembly protein PilP